MDRRLVGLGLFLVTAGAVMLAVRQGLIPGAVAQRAGTLWPLILVGSGLSILLAGRPGASLGGLVVAVTFGAMLGGIAATGWSGGFAICAGDRAGTPFPDQSGTLRPGASVSIAINCGNLDLTTAGASAWSVSGTSSDGAPPAIGTADGDLTVRNADRGPFVGGGGGSRWTVAIPVGSDLALDVATNGGSSRVILEGATLREASFATNAGSLTVDLRGVAAIGTIDLQTNAGSTTVRLPARSLAGSIEVNAGSMALCVPSGAGLRVNLGGIMSSNDLSAHGLVRTGPDGAWETPSFASAGIRLELAVDVNAGSFSIDATRECAG